LTAIIPGAGADHGEDNRDAGGAAEIVDNAVCDEPNAKHCDGE
jgi:hypothetical protein